MILSPELSKYDAFSELAVAVRGETFVMASSDERSFGIQIAGVDVAHESSVSSIPVVGNEGVSFFLMIN